MDSAGRCPSLIVQTLLVCALLTPPATAQTFRLSLGGGSPGGTAQIEISLRSSAGKDPASLQWETSLPPELGFDDPIATPGPSAQAAGKSVKCARKDRDDPTRTSLCVLTGGEKPIGDGVIAILHLRIPSHVRKGSYRVTIEHGLAATKDLKQLTIPVVETLVVVRPH